MGANTARSWQQNWQENISPNRHSEPKRQVKVKVAPKRWITTGEKVIYSLVSTVVVGALFLTVSFSSSADAMNRDVQQLEKNISKQEELNQNLQYKVKELSNPDRILSIAKENGLKIQNTQIKQASQLSN